MDARQRPFASVRSYHIICMQQQHDVFTDSQVDQWLVALPMRCCWWLQLPQKEFTPRRTTRGVAGTLRAVVRFTCTEEAHRAVREKQGGFLLNAPITLRVLQ